MPHYAPFVLFGRSHQIVLVLTVLVPVLLAVLVRSTKNNTLARAIRFAFAAVIAGDWLYWYWLFAERHWLVPGNELPMDLCSWAAIATIVSLINANPKSFELAYFWALAGTVQGLLRPGIDYDFPDPLFVEFCIFHAVIIAAVLFMALGLKLRPTLASFPRVIGWSIVYMGAAGLVDWVLGVNYGFMRAKPAYHSLFDLMPAWPWYIPVLVALGVLSMAVYYLPFLIIDLVRRPR